MIFSLSSFFFKILCILIGTVLGQPLPEERSNHKITVALSERIPFVILNHNGMPTGLDVLIVENFAKRLHFQIDYVIVNSSLNYVFAHERHLSAFSIQTNLSKIDLFIGALDVQILKNEKFIASRPYYHDVLTWCVQKEQPIPKWMNIFYLCQDPMVWVLMTAMTLAVLCMGYFIEQFEDYQPKYDWHTIMLFGICCLCGFACACKTKITSHRIFFGFCLYGSLIYNIFLISTMINFMNKPIYEDHVGSIQQIINRSYELAGDDFALEHLMKQNKTYPTEMLQNFKVCSSMDHCLSQLEDNAKLAVAISHEHALKNHWKSSVHLYCFEKSEAIYEYALKFMVRKSFLYLNELNWFIGQASASGLIEKWRADNNFGSKWIHDEKSTQFTLRNAYGFGMIAYICLIFSTIIFFLEKFIYKKVRTLNSSRFWHFAEMIIDPDRHFWLETKMT